MKANEIAEQFEKLKKSLPMVEVKTKRATWTMHMTQKGILSLGRKQSGDSFGYDWEMPIEVAVKLKEFLNEYY